MTGNSIPSSARGRVATSRSRKTRRPLRAIAAVALFAVVGTLAAASAAAADNAAIAVPGIPGYVSTVRGENWVMSGTQTAQGPMPGNMPGPVTVSTASGLSNRALALNTTDGDVSGTSPNHPVYVVPADRTSTNVFSSCLPNAADKQAGALKLCKTDSASLTFPRPVVDPIISFSTGWDRPGEKSNPNSSNWPDAGGCAVAFSTGGISKVNGTTPASGQVALANSAGPTPGTWSPLSLVNNEVVPSGSYPAPTSACNLGALGTIVINLKITGLVTSLQLDFPTYLNVYKNITVNSVYTSMTFPWGYVGFAVPYSDLSIVKSAPATVAPGAALAWGLTVTNKAGGSSHGFVIQDVVPASVSNPRLVNPPAGCSLSGRNVTCTSAPQGFTVNQDSTASTFANLSPTPVVANPTAVGSVLDPGQSMTVQLVGDVPLSASGSIPNTATVSGADPDPDTSNNSSTVSTDLTLPTWTVGKTATVGGTRPVGGVVKPGDVITYTVTATSSSGDIAGAVISDNLSDVLSSATFNSGSARLTVGGGAPGAVADPTGSPTMLTTPAFTLTDGQKATLTYQVTVRADAWLSTLTNTASATSSSSAAPTCDPSCSTTNTTGALVQILKTGVDADGTSAAVDGAAFQVLADSSGQPGAVITAAPATSVSGQTGRFRVEGLMPGTFWLKETAAPTGYELLPQPIAFTIAANGSLSVVDTHANPNVTASGGLLTVADSSALHLPLTGGKGAAIYLGAGGAALLAAYAAAVIARRRRRGCA